VSTTNPEAWDAGYTPAYRARNYLTDRMAAFVDDTVDLTLDANQCGGDTFPEHFARLQSQWAKCVDAAEVIHARFDTDWNRAGGPLTVIAPAVRDAALSELRIVWNTLARNYVAETLDIDRLPFDCIFCGTHVPRGGRFDHRCPECMCVLNLNDDETDWL